MFILSVYNTATNIQKCGYNKPPFVVLLNNKVNGLYSQCFLNTATKTRPGREQEWNSHKQGIIYSV